MDKNVNKRLQPYRKELLDELLQYGMIFQDEHYYLSVIGPMSDKCDDITDFLEMINQNNGNMLGGIEGGAAWPDYFYYQYDIDRFNDSNYAEKYAQKVMNWIRTEVPDVREKDKSFIQLYEQNNNH